MSFSLETRTTIRTAFMLAFLTHTVSTLNPSLGARGLKTQRPMRTDLEEKLQETKQEAEELKARLEEEAQNHADELRKHKAALMQLLKNQCRLESEMGRGLGHVAAAKEELKEVVLRKAEADAMVVKLSEDVAKMQKDCELKDNVLSAVMRTCKLDAAEKQVLLKEVDRLRAEKKQAEVEMERWRELRQSRHKKSSRNLLAVEAGCSKDKQLELQNRCKPNHLLFEYLKDQGRKYRHLSDEPGTLDERCQQQDDWIRGGHEEKNKYAAILEQKHHQSEVEAFTEQLRQKDEKLEDAQRQILQRELENKMLQSHIDGLDGCLSYLREENVKLEALVMDKEEEVKLLKEQLSFLLQHYQKSNQSYSSSAENCQQKTNFTRNTLQSDITMEEKASQNVIYRESEDIDIGTSNSTNSESQIRNDAFKEQPERVESSFQDPAETNSVALNSLQQVKDPIEDLSTCAKPNYSPGKDAARAESSWKTDIHAVAVSYNIKRLKQQLLMLEKLAGLLANRHLTDTDTSSTTAGANGRSKSDESRQKMKGFNLMKSLLQKQVSRYQSLEEKTDDLYRRMYEDYQSGSRREKTQGNNWTKEQTETLKCYLEETFELQKYFVATGQKFLEMQSKMNSSFSGADANDKSMGFNLRQFADIIRTIFRQVHKGLEVRIARVIGDLEGKLACDSILQR